MKVVILREAYLQTGEIKALNWKQTLKSPWKSVKNSFKTISTFPNTVYDEITVKRLSDLLSIVQCTTTSYPRSVEVTKLSKVR
jgi:hypothetical protein